MKLLTIATTPSTTTAAVLVDGAPVALPYEDVGALLADGEGIERAREAAAGRPSGELAPGVPAVRPIARPGAVVCVGLNYRKHIVETGYELPEVPALFSKLPRALTDPYADVVLPAASGAVDYEGELAVVVGRGGRDIAVEDAMAAVAGYTALNDVSMRDYQARSVQWFAGKSWEAATPVGPVVVTPDELADLARAELAVTVNGELRQRSALDDLVFDVPYLVADISKIFTLMPGDIISTGTPHGVGFAMDPPQVLRDGDLVEVSISGIGTLRNRFVAPPR